MSFEVEAEVAYWTAVASLLPASARHPALAPQAGQDPRGRSEVISPSAQHTSFLWTIGPRPFWELWPHKKHKKKKLNLEEFIQCLLEQWAATHRYPVEQDKSFVSPSPDLLSPTV